LNFMIVNFFLIVFFVITFGKFLSSQSIFFEEQEREYYKPEYWFTPLFRSDGPLFGVENMKKDMDEFLRICPELSPWEVRWLVDKAEMRSCLQYEIDEALTKKRKKTEETVMAQKIEPISYLELRRVLIKEILKQAEEEVRQEKKILYKVFKEMIEKWKNLRPEDKFIKTEDKDTLKYDVYPTDFQWDDIDSWDIEVEWR